MASLKSVKASDYITKLKVPPFPERPCRPKQLPIGHTAAQALSYAEALAKYELEEKACESAKAEYNLLYRAMSDDQAVLSKKLSADLVATVFQPNLGRALYDFAELSTEFYKDAEDEFATLEAYYEHLIKCFVELKSKYI